MARISAHSTFVDFSKTADFSGNQLSLDSLACQFEKQTTDRTNLLAMTAGGFTYRLARVASLSLFSALPSFLRSPLTSLFSLSAEVAAFRGVNHISHPSVEKYWDFRAFAREMINFGTLKSSHRILASPSPLLAHVSQNLGMMLGEEAGIRLDLNSEVAGSFAQRFVHASSMNLALGLGTVLSAHFTGHRLNTLERHLEQTAAFFVHRQSQIQNDSRVLQSTSMKSEGSDLHQTLLGHLGDAAVFRRYIRDNFDAEDPRLSEFVATLTSIDQVHVAQAVIASLRFQGWRSEVSESMRQHFSDAILGDSNPAHQVTGETWLPGKALIHETIDWFRSTGFRHSDPWTRYYAVRFAFEWARAHPEIASAEFASLRARISALAIEAQCDPFQANFMLGWNLFHLVEPEASMSEGFYENFPFQNSTRGGSEEFGLPVYISARTTESAYRGFFMSLRGPATRLRNAQLQKRSLYEIYPHHSLADFNPDAHLRKPVLREKFALLQSLKPERLNPYAFANDYYHITDPLCAPAAKTWKGRESWIGQSHHRSTALYLAAEDNPVFRGLAQQMAVWEVDWSPYYPFPVFRHFMLRGAKRPLDWEDLLPTRKRLKKLWEE